MIIAAGILAYAVDQVLDARCGVFDRLPSRHQAHPESFFSHQRCNTVL
jgi:hypothetical protein